MEVCIRLQKAGKSANKCYNYRIVAISRSQARQGKHLDILGHYNPAQKTASFTINHEKLDKWLAKGARMSATVKSLAAKAGKK
jgi:small subunit ribosomal protein S16